MRQIRITITGTAPLLMHSDRFANPLDPATKAHKELTSEKKKTDDIHTAIARSEFIASCYWQPDVGFFIPGQNLESCLYKAAAMQKLGVKFKQAVRVLDDAILLEGPSAKSPEELWEKLDHRDCRGVRVGASKVMRYRPIFKKWALKTTVVCDEDVVNVREIEKAVSDAGALIGLGDFRPRYGRFSAKVTA